MEINKTSEWVGLIGGMVGIVAVATSIAVWLLSVKIEEQARDEVATQLLDIDGPEDVPAFITMQSDVANLKTGQAHLIEVNDKIYDKLLEIAERNSGQ